MNQPSLHSSPRLKGGIIILVSMLFVMSVFPLLPVGAQETLERNSETSSQSVVPGDVTAENFAALKSNSPFVRSLNLSDSLILTGVARIGGRLYVTLFDLKTKDTHIVSQKNNNDGWRLVEIDGQESDLETITAQISTAGGEVIAVRYDERQLDPKIMRRTVTSGTAGSGAKPPVPERDYRQGISGDGFRGAPPPELVKKLSQLKEDDRNRLIQQIREIRDKGVSSEERQVIFNRMVDRALQQRR